ncbi:MAG TPA: GatB/YqeY domain-containing protein [Thermodesulfobacteriota bacterium]|nr:GatB/YqeY domain-containing protein [Thermodesulfobacteriota bacterium]
MGLQEKIPQDLKEALRGKRELELSVLRMLQSSIKNKEIEKRKKELSDEEVIEVVGAEVKKRKEAAAEFEKVNRQDAADREKAEIEILMKYMPAQMSEDEIRAQVKKAVTESGADGIKDLGKVMKIIIPALKGKADGAVVNRIVREELEKPAEG